MSILAALLLAVTCTADAATGALSIRAENDPVVEVLAALRQAAKVNYVLDAAVEARPVTIDGRYDAPAEAVRAIAAAAGLAAEEAGGVFLVRLPAPKPAAPAPVGFPVTVLTDAPEHAARRKDLAAFEQRAGTGLIVMPKLKERALREYLEARDVLREKLAAAKVAIDLRGDVDMHSARVYVEVEKGLYYVEILFSTGERGAEIAHFVFIVDVQSQACKELVIFKLPA